MNTNTNPAARYNKARHHAFSLLNNNPWGKENLEKQLSYIYDKLKNDYKLESKALYGLMAELRFKLKYGDQFDLCPALDCGDKTDFTGEINGHHARIDVTTNLGYKNIWQYARQPENSKRMYYCIMVDGKTGQIVQSVPEIQGVCGLNVKNSVNPSSTTVDLLIFHEADMDKEGCSKNNPYQEVITVDLENGNQIVACRVCTEWYIESINSYVRNLPDEMDEEQVFVEIDRYCDEIVRLFNKEYGCNIMGCLSYEYHMFTPDGDGEFGNYLRWLHPLMKKSGYQLGEEIVLDLY